MRDHSTSYAVSGSFLIFILIGVTMSQTLPAPTSPTKANEADAFWQAQKWDDAAASYELVVKVDPANGQAWFRLGSSLISLNRFEESIAPLEKAVEILDGSITYYTLGSAYAKLSNKDKAFANLTKAAARGFGQLNRLNTDPNLEEIRQDGRFSGLLEGVERNARPCKYSSEAKQLDFWVGEWDVTVNGRVVGINNIQRLEEGCLIMENWTGQSGSTGKSMNFYNPVTKKWRQTYMSNGQVIWEMSGEYKNGAMRFEGEVISQSGRVMTKVVFYNIAPDKLRHTEDNSRDNGKTWANIWDAVYVRRKGAAGSGNPQQSPGR